MPYLEASLAFYKTPLVKERRTKKGLVVVFDPIESIFSGVIHKPRGQNVKILDILTPSPFVVTFNI